MLRVNRLAAAIDMMAAGTRAPIAMAAKPKPTNQSGNILSNSSGMVWLLLAGLIPAAIAMNPSRASRPSRKL
jgi:hypothetical protein